MSLTVANKLRTALEFVRTEAPELPTQQLHILVAVYLSEGRSMSYIQDACKLSDTAGTRNMHSLGHITMDGKPGKGWLRIEKHGREKLVFLTDTGRAYVTQILKALE